MTYDIQSFLIYINTIIIGLTAGICFIWTNTISPGIGRLDDLLFLQTFQQLNREIINPFFISVFMGPVVLYIMIFFLKYKTLDDHLLILLIAGIIYFIGVAIVTIIGNIPLNEMLDKTNLEKLSINELNILRENFEKPWNNWHLVRSICSFISFALLLYDISFKIKT